MGIDLSKFPIIDDHCHPFVQSRESKTFDNCFTLSLIPPISRNTRNTLLFRIARNELIKHYNVNSSITDDELIKIRNEKYRTNPKAYVDKMFKEVNFESFLVDYGFPVMGERLSKQELDWFHETANTVNVRRIHRVESTFHPLFEEKIGFDELESKYLAVLREEVEKKGTIAFKTVIAYHTGLNIQKTSKKQASQSYEQFIADPANRKAEKQVRDYLVLLAFELCLEYDIPIQMHSGAGDAPMIDVKQSSPLLMHTILSDPHYQNVKIIFVHTAYPFVEEAGYLVNQYPNLYLDLSSMIPFSSIGIYPKLRQILEMAPFTKVLYGSDGFTIPEISWLGARLIKSVLAKVLEDLIGEGIIDESYAYQVASMILSENARSLYKKNWEVSMNQPSKMTQS